MMFRKHCIQCIQQNLYVILLYFISLFYYQYLMGS